MLTNLETGVQRAMVVSLVASGVSDQQARERVTADKIASGLAHLKAAFKQAQRSGQGDDEACWDQAFQSLRAWTPANT